MEPKTRLVSWERSRKQGITARDQSPRGTGSEVKGHGDWGLIKHHSTQMGKPAHVGQTLGCSAR